MDPTEINHQADTEALPQKGSELSTDSDQMIDQGLDRAGSSLTRQHYIVGIGASAGGLEALERVFRSMPLDTGMSFVVVQHLSPDFKSHMDQLLGRVTGIPIRVVDDGMEVQPDTIYLIPPKMVMFISNGRLLLTERSKEKVLSHPIDQFLRALAQDVGRYAIGMVLSGTGSDGSRGISAIADNGGLVIAQDPSSCKFDSMPRNAQETGQVHLVLEPEVMGDALSRYTVDGKSPTQLQQQEIESHQETGIPRVFQLLKRNHRIDFTHYKSGTVGRRMQRRIDLLNLGSVDNYIEYIEDNPAEINELYKDLLIGVTRFFRDTEAFEVLEKEVIPELVRNCDDLLRVWVCACASGEEAYTIAMLISEAIEASPKNIDFKIFATDAHRESLQFASTGLYDESSMEDVSPRRRERFFNKRSDGYLVNATLRRCIVFAPQNVINDPPFTQMHLVTCRNMLIYFQPPAQRKTLSLFHFALRNGGVLFLGPSESAGEIGDEFETINSPWKIFRKRRDVRLPVELRMPMLSNRPALSGSTTPSTASEVLNRRANDVLPEAYDTLLGELMPPSVLVDGNFQVLHVFAGGNDFLRVPTGRLSTNVLEMVDKKVKSSVATAIQQALKVGNTVRYSGLPHPQEAIQKQICLTVRPLSLRAAKEDCLLIQFELTEPIEPVSPPTDEIKDYDFSEVATSRINDLEQELSYSRQNLQSTIEELETSNEELQATNEEMVAANEELQSTNEELHSVNEELYTVNAEHQARVNELDEANTYMTNLLATTKVGVLFLDTGLFIRRFTPAIGRLLGMEAQDIGRNMETYVSQLNDDQFLDRLRDVVELGEAREWESDVDGEPYLCRGLPFQKDDAIEGVIVSIVNVSGLRKAEEDVARFKFMADENIEAQVLVDEVGQVVYANKKMFEQLGYSSDELGLLSVARFDTQHDITKYREIFERAFREGGLTIESEHRHKSGEVFPVETAVTPVAFSGTRYLFATIRDTTLRIERESQMNLLSNAVGSAVNGIIVSDASKPDRPIIFANEGFVKMTGYPESEILGRNCRFLQGENTNETDIREIRQALNRGETSRTLLKNYKKDGTEFWNDLYITPVTNKNGELSHFVGIQNDVTERVEAGERAKENERTIRLLLDSTAEGVFGLDINGVCTFCNESAATMFGCDCGEDIVKSSIHAAIQPKLADGSDHPIDQSTILKALKNGQPDNRSDEVFVRRDGSYFPVEFWCHPIRLDDKIVGAVVTFVDITERLQIQNTLTEARDEANAANEAKSRFLANMSHELRTPLSAMLGFARIAQEEHGDVEGLHEKLETIQRNGDYLLRLLGEVLDLSRIEAGKLSTSRKIVSLQEIMSDVHSTMQMRTEEYGNVLEFKLFNPLPARVTTDPARLRQVMINLIANALKFTPKGRVEVSIHSVERMKNETTRNVLKIDVADNGIGIARKKLKTLFEPFVQADRSISDRFGGTGLGLSITKRLVKAMGGKIGVQSKFGVGSTFTFEIPVDPIEDIGEVEMTVQERLPADEPELATKLLPDNVRLGVKVLIADDVRDIRFVARHFLSKADCEIEVAENGRQAVDMVVAAEESGKPFELILMDMQMPELDGEGAVTELRNLGFEVPIIALTADAMKGTRRRLIALGFDEYLSKPFDVKKLLRVASDLLNL